MADRLTDQEIQDTAARYLGAPDRKLTGDEDALVAQYLSDAGVESSATSAPEVDNSNWVDRVNAVGQGASFGFADEVGTALAATMAKLSGADEDWSAIRKDMMASEQAKREHYAEMNPGENLALNVAGGFLTGGAGGGKALASQVAKQGTKLKKAMTAIGGGAALGAVEGGVAGAGMAENMSDVPEAVARGTGTGMLTGFAIPAAGTAVRQGLDVASNRRVKESLMDAAGNFIPINIAAPDTFIGDTYQNIFGRSLGGRGIRRESKKYVDRLEQKVVDTDAEFADDLFKTSLPDSMGFSELDMADPQASYAKVKQAWRDKGFSSVKDESFDVDPAIMMQDIMDAVDDPALEGFADELVSLLETNVAGKIKKGMNKVQGYGGTGTPTKGKISGEDLTNLRNKFRMRVNTLAGSSDGQARLKGAAYAKAAETIDAQILKQLPEESRKVFESELSNYGRYSVLRKAMVKAGKMESDLPTPKQVLTSVGTSDRVAAGTAPHQGLAKTELKRNAALKAKVKEAKSLTPPVTGGVQQAAQAGMVGKALNQDFTWPQAIAAGAGTVLGATTQKGQRIVAGQTQKQALLREALEAYDGSSTKKAASALSTALRRGLLVNPEIY